MHVTHPPVLTCDFTVPTPDANMTNAHETHTVLTRVTRFVTNWFSCLFFLLSVVVRNDQLTPCDKQLSQHLQDIVLRFLELKVKYLKALRKSVLTC